MKAFLLGMFLVIMSLTATAKSEMPIETAVQISNGIQGGLYDRLSMDQKDIFLQHLGAARDTLYLSSQAQYACINQGSDYYAISNLDTGKTYGKAIYGLQACKDTLPEAGNSYNCLHQGNDYYSVANLRQEKVYGKSLYGLSNCKEGLPKSGQKLACIHQGNDYWQVTNLQTGLTFGSSVYGLAACKAQLP